MLLVLVLMRDMRIRAGRDRNLAVGRGGLRRWDHERGGGALRVVVRRFELGRGISVLDMAVR